MAFNLAQKFISLGTPVLLAKELANQIENGGFNADRLVWTGMVPALARYVAQSLAQGTFSGVKALEYGMTEAVAGLIKANTTPIAPSNNLVAYTGDSRLAQGTLTATPAAQVFENNGIQFWSLGLSGGRGRLIFANNFAISGNTTQDVVDSIPSVVAAGVGVASILVSINDRVAGVDLAWTTSRLQSAITALRAANIVVHLYNEMPVTILSAAQTAIHLQVRDWINAKANPGRGIWVSDTYNALAISNDSDTPAPGVYRDDRHPSTLGAYLASVPVAEALTRMLPEDPTVLPADASDPRLISTNPFMTGTSGTITAANDATGVIATGFTYLRASAAAGITCTLSKETLDDGAEWQKYVFGGTPAATAAVDIARQQNLQAGLGGAQYAESVMKVRFSTDALNLRSVKCGTRIVGVQDNWHTAGDETVNAGDVIPTFPEVVEMIIRSPRVLNPGSLTNLALRPGLYPVTAVPCGGTIWIGCCALMKYDNA